MEVEGGRRRWRCVVVSGAGESRSKGELDVSGMCASRPLESRPGPERPRPTSSEVGEQRGFLMPNASVTGWLGGPRIG